MKSNRGIRQVLPEGQDFAACRDICARDHATQAAAFNGVHTGFALCGKSFPADPAERTYLNKVLSGRKDLHERCSNRNSAEAKQAPALLILTHNQTPFTDGHTGADAATAVVLPDLLPGIQ
jgi:hypothetical protein